MNMILATMATVGLMLSPVYASEPTTGLEVMKLVEARDDGKDLTQKMMQRLVDKRGNVRERQLITFSKDYGL
ncbi:MAG: hypothetical protein Q9M44_07825, partial [Ghiorsea sp.]|nr:hypothetical protein [Ghiorsea sp.]